jgi:hypothetical protein
VPFIEPGRKPLLEVGAPNLVSLDVRSCIEIGTVPQQDRSIRGSSCDHFRKTSLRYFARAFLNSRMINGWRLAGGCPTYVLEIIVFSEFANQSGLNNPGRNPALHHNVALSPLGHRGRMLHPIPPRGQWKVSTLINPPERLLQQHFPTSIFGWLNSLTGG